MSVWSWCAYCSLHLHRFLCVCACVCWECVGLTGEVVSRESLGEPRRVSMQQIKTGPFHFQLSIMKDGFRKPQPFKEQDGNRHTHMHDVTHYNSKTRFPTSQTHKHTQSQFLTHHYVQSIINTQSQPHVISPYRFFIELNQAAITQKLTSAIKSFLLIKRLLMWTTVDSGSFLKGKHYTVSGRSPKQIQCNVAFVRGKSASVSF